MSVYSLITRRRSIRRFKQTPISFDILKKLVDAARLAPSATNLQPLQYIIVDDKDQVNALFGHTQWARLLPNNSGRPAENQQPVAFIVILANKALETAWTNHDVGAAVENMILTALEEGIGSCWIASVNRPYITETFHIPENYKVDSVLGLGYPDEDPVAEPLPQSTDYYKDDKGRLHVPKRSLDEVLHHNGFQERGNTE